MVNVPAVALAMGKQKALRSFRISWIWGGGEQKEAELLQLVVIETYPKGTELNS